MRSLAALFVCFLSPIVLVAAESAPASEKAPATVTHALRGVITAIDVKKSAVRVKHEKIPGFMPAMTMEFLAAPADLQPLSVGQTITATLYEKDDDYWLRDIRTITPPGK